MSTEKSDSGRKRKYEIFHGPQVEADFNRLTDAEFRRIDEKISALTNDPRPPHSQKIDTDTYRLRSGDWRVIYLVDDRRQRVVVSHVKRRNERTYR